MTKIRKTVRQLYVRPTIDVVRVASEGSLLAGSPLVRPGGGGTGSQTPGTIQVVPPTSDDSNPDDEIEG
ncbi:hypothetical protein [Prevotella melaninogenica]|uniref:hypothetical protein n=1 Tax=Prevotella melaninogenica TaxID=28132 RepID=UPI002010D12A|nr:hypothetical protein [Prevotella melaninogenica]